jgi:formylglycine-generating enzyme required for sulfatase activity
MKVTIFFIAFSLLMISISAQEDSLQVQIKIQNIENDINGMTLSERMKLYKVPGLSIALINNNKTEWSKAYGVINSETNVPATNETLFEAASVTKTLVSATALYFVEQGLIDLDKDINEYLQSWKIPENEFTKENEVTLRLLLSHQSGFSSTNLPYKEGAIPTLVQVLRGELPALNEPATVQYKPGADWEYSNLGYLVIQMLLEDLTGKSLNQIMTEVIFEPLEMRSGTLDYFANKDLKNKVAFPHDASGNACEIIAHPTALAQGSLITTPSDLAKFTIELAKASQGISNQILSQKMTQTMLTSELALDPAIFGGTKFDQGLGVFLRGFGNDQFFGHNGDSYPGATCLLGSIPARGKGVIIMTNSATGLPLILEILSKIENEYNWPKYEESNNFETEEIESAETEEIKFVLVKGGSFEMGNTFENMEGDTDEIPIHTVTLNDFYMSETEITNAQYDKFCELSGIEKPSRIPGLKGENIPAMKISWFEAQAFCEYYGYRLPTEAEWEFAAREGGKKVRFANGQNISRDSEINFNAKSKDKTSYSEAGKFRRKPLPVKSFPSNSLGLYDMSGNLAEWCMDYYDEFYYKNSPVNNPLCEKESKYRVLRGGHIFSTPKYIRCTHRDARLPETKNYEFGFRVVKDAF